MSRDHIDGEQPDFDVRRHLSGRYIPPDSMPPRPTPSGGGGGRWIFALLCLLLVVAVVAGVKFGWFG